MHGPACRAVAPEVMGTDKGTPAIAPAIAARPDQPGHDRSCDPLERNRPQMGQGMAARIDLSKQSVSCARCAQDVDRQQHLMHRCASADTLKSCVPRIWLVLTSGLVSGCATTCAASTKCTEFTVSRGAMIETKSQAPGLNTPRC